MNRLPTFDRATQRGELVSFASLALVGMAIITLAGAQMTKFAVGHERVAEALAAPDTATASWEPAGTPLATNRPSTHPLLSATKVSWVPSLQ